MSEKKVRQLAAVMFTDIVGYTALMQNDEAIATQARTRHREVFQQSHQLYKGKIIQYFGDGTLSVFKSAIEAAQCAIQIQKSLNEGETPVPLKIGLHLGDIVFADSDVYGDGVNIASRVESLATAGSILLSEKMNDELKNHPTILTSSLGYFELKNITQAIEVFAVSNNGIKVPLPSQIEGKQVSLNKTIAVLPFVNLSSNKDNEYFSDGITEEIINALSGIKSLKVTSRTSSFFFKNKNIPIKQIARDLGVSTILEGSIRLSGNTIRITAQLIQAKEDFHFWSETWDRKLENIFEIQDEISLIIADKLREQFGHFEIQGHLVEKQTDNIQAYEYSLKAKFYLNKWNPEDVKMALSLYQKALDLDPNHSESYLGLADCYSFLGTTGFMPYAEAWEKTNYFIRQALQRNDQLSGVHYQLANQAFFTECDYKKSLMEMKKAVAINPNNAEAQQFLAFLYVIAGNIQKAREHLDIATSINPLSEETLFFKGYYFYMTEDYEKALNMLNERLLVNDKNIPAHYLKSLCLLMLGRYDEVINYFDTIPKDVVIIGEKTGAIGLAYVLKKDRDNSAKYLELLREQAKDTNGFTADSYLYLMYALAAENDKAFEWVEQAIKNKAALLMIRYADPLAKNLREDPRFEKFHKQIFETDPEPESEDAKKKKALLDSETIAVFTDKLLNHMTENKPYLDAGLSLRSLAKQIDIHPNQLSWLLNESIGMNFNDYINRHRIETFKTLAKDPKHSNITIMGLAYDSGFNSKTVFNNCFKKETGLTPKQFLKRQQIKSPYTEDPF